MTRKTVFREEKGVRGTSKDRAVEERANLEDSPLNVSRTQPPPKTKPGGGKPKENKPTK